MPWCPDHLTALARVETAVLAGGLYAYAMPRGSGKTAIATAAALWALLCGHREFVCLIGATEEHAVELLDSLRAELETNPLLLADYNNPQPDRSDWVAVTSGMTPPETPQ
jgi:hypothetical protein